jgi:trehalose utilization protein
MTGPLFFTLHPDRRRARLLLPFAAAILVGQLACTSDQPTEPTAAIKAQTVVATSGPHPRARLAPAPRAASLRAKPLVSFNARSSFSLSQSLVSGGPSVLILADTDAVSTDALAASLADSGVQVTVRPAPEYTWDGTNPSLAGFDVVIHLNGATYDYVPSLEAQDALTSFVQNGGGFVGAQWNGYDPQPNLSNLVLQGAGFDANGPEHNCTECTVTYERLPAGVGHPVLAGLPASFSFPADGHDAGPAADFATPLMQVSSGGPAVLVRELGSGRVVGFSFAPNYPFDDGGFEHPLRTLGNAEVQHLYLNAVRWAAGSGAGVAEPQSITFELQGSKAFGDASFTVSAIASSGLPVNFTASGQCTVVGSTVSVTGAGSCTITAHQAGNDAYAPAADVSDSFEILKATPGLTWVPGSLGSGTPLGPSQLNATAAGLNGAPLSGTYTYTPARGTLFAAGTYSVSVVFAPADPNYAPASATASLTVYGGMSFSGFFAPIRNMPYVNKVQAGSSVPVKFTVGSYRGLSVMREAPSSVPATCPAGAAENVVQPGLPSVPGLRSLGYSYNYVWKTSPAWAGTCRKFVLTLADGSTHEALFRFAAAPKKATAKRILGK